jgi:hypothetical protein
MEMTELTIHLPADVSLELAKKARSSGQEVAEYVEELVSKQVKRPPLDEILAPIRDNVERSGMTESQLEAPIEREVQAVRSKRRLRGTGS